MASKTLNDSVPLQLIEPPTRLRIPLATHSPVELVPQLISEKMVARGQPLTTSPSDGGPAVLAPTSGRIIGTCMITLTNGQTVPAVELEPDFQDRRPHEEHDAHFAQEQKQEIESLSRITSDDLGQWIDRLRNMGIWADRNSSPDFVGQLHQVLRRPVDTVLCNIVDHDPTLRVQAGMAGRFNSVLLHGVALLSRLTGARNTWIAVEAASQNKWWLPLRREMKKDGIDIVPVLADYPQADPTLLLHTLLRRRLRPGRLPVEQGVLMIDAVTAIAVGRAAIRQQPLLQTPVAIRDHLRGESHWLLVAVGTPIRHVLEHLKLPVERITLCRGDTLREQHISPEHILAGGEVAIHLMRERRATIADPCIRCGWCVLTCPTRVQPAGLLEAAQRNDAELAEQHGLGACIECGICSYVCPSHLPLLTGIRALKQSIRQG